MIYWIWLTQLPFIGPVTARYLIEELKDAENKPQGSDPNVVNLSPEC